MHRPHALFTPFTAGIATLFCVSLLCAGYAVADSAHSSKHVLLEAGGHTIAGPGHMTVNGNDESYVLKLADGHERLLCATAHNHGRGNASLRILDETGDIALNGLVKKDRTRAICSMGSRVAIACESRDCKVRWRVDLVPQ